VNTTKLVVYALDAFYFTKLLSLNTNSTADAFF